MCVSVVRFTRSTESANATRTSLVEDTFVLDSRNTRTVGGCRCSALPISHHLSNHLVVNSGGKIHSRSQDGVGVPLERSALSVRRQLHGVF